MKNIKDKLSLLIFFLLIFFYVEAGVIINEVMANVKGLDSGAGSPGDRNEFVEIYNNSNDTINIIGYYFFDGKAKDYIIKWPDTLLYPGGIIDTILPPYSYGVVLDPEYIDIGDGNYYMIYEIPSNSYVFTINNTLFGDNGLSTRDYLIFYDENDSMIDTYGTPFDEFDDFPYDPGDGISLERLNPFLPDVKSNWNPSLDEEGHTIGRENSNIIRGAIIDSFWVDNDEKLYVLFKYDELERDSILIEFENKNNEMYAITDSLMCFDIDGEKIVNISTSKTKIKYSALTFNNNYKNSICYNEFMVKGSDDEWLELYNPFSIDFHGKDLTLFNNDSLKLPSIYIPKDSFVVLCKDSLILKNKFPYFEMNIFQCRLFNLPDREDTFLLIYQGNVIDSVIRGYKDMGYVSIERLSHLIEGYRKDNWDMCVNEYKATPSAVNSIRKMSFENKNKVELNTSILDGNTLLCLNIDTEFSTAVLNINVYNDLGILIESRMDRIIAGVEYVPVKLQIESMKNGLYIMHVEVKDRNSQNKIIKKLLFAVRR